MVWHNRAMKRSLNAHLKPVSFGFLQLASAELIDRLESMAGMTSLARGQTLFRQGDASDALFVLVEGALDVNVLAEDGRKLTVNTLFSGEVFGEIGLFDGHVRTATVTAIEKSKVGRIPKPRLFDEIGRDATIAVELLRLASARLRWIHGLLEDRAFEPVAVRLARRLLALADIPRGHAHELRLSQAQLADHVGATREAVARVLSGWRRDGLVDLARGRIVLRDPEALAEIARLAR